MNMTLLVNPWERAARIVEAHAFAAGDVATVAVNGVQGADPASLQLRLFRDATMRQPVAAAGAFEPLPGRRDAFSASLPLDSSDMLDWFDDSVSESSGDDGEDVVRLLRLTPEDRAERAVRTDGWLVVADSSRVWVACRVPVILRAFPGLGRVPTDSWSAAVRAAVLEASTQADWEESSEGSPAFIKNKPAPVQADWDESSSGAPAFIKNKPAPVQADWDESSSGDPAFIRNKPVPVQADWDESSSGDPAFIKNKPTIPAPVSVDAKFKTPGAAADAKAVGDALRGGFTEWVCVPATYNGKTLHVERGSEEWNLYADNQFLDPPTGAPSDATSLTFSVYGVTATRHAFPPTKTSQLENDGAPNCGGNEYVMTNDTRLSDERTPTAHRATHAANGSDPLAPADIGAASLSDLPYRLVTPGEWEFSGVPTRWEITDISYELGDWSITYLVDGEATDSISTQGAEDALSLTFAYSDEVHIIATRASLPGHLLDRAVNAVPVSGPTTLTLPEKMDGKSRDFYVRLTVSAESAISFAATDSGGDTVAWDSMGDPSGTFAAGTYLYRFTEVAAGVFHAADITNGGSVDPAVLDEKLDASSAAPPFRDSLTYLVGEYVTYGGILYRCKIAVTVAGPWTGDSNWVDVDMTSPDATLDVRSDGRLAVVAADGEILWIQGYDMASASDVVLSCDKVNFYEFASGTVTQAFNMPSAPGGKVGDFVLDIDNSANASTAATATLNGFGTSFDVIVPKGQNLFTDILSFEGGEMCELYFTMTAFGTAAKPAWKVVKQVVEKQEFGS